MEPVMPVAFLLCVIVEWKGGWSGYMADAWGRRPHHRVSTPQYTISGTPEVKLPNVDISSPSL